jgi:ubiquinone/menaquinone biosynthesis C-methylase UbiE
VALARTTLALAERVAPEGRALGIDISKPMLAVARSRAAETGNTAEFVEADITHYALPARSFDLGFSQLGVMFFPIRSRLSGTFTAR